MSPPTFLHPTPKRSDPMLRHLRSTATLVCGIALTACAAPSADAQDDAAPGFFITSVNPGEGANLGGLAGADAYCATLAGAAGLEGRTWAAYLSSSEENARDRIGSGPWYNVDGTLVAEDVEQLLDGDANLLAKPTSLSESGEVINGRGDEPNRHDILTGSDADGMLVGEACGDWTSDGEGSAVVGHHDRTGGGDDPTSWSSAHGSRGCGLEDLRATGGDGLFYCFATD